ncbi:MAG: nuclear transport factor 2 family protein [Novosphingobium sp.]|nr:nuclear transport factor 2 family protein [Novosphingobium sp.]
MTNLEQRISRLEDRAAIQDLVAAYFCAIDLDDYEAVAKCFTADAAFVASGFSGDHTREAIIAFLKEARAHMGQTVHTPHYVQIEFTGNGKANGTVAAHLELGLGDKTYFGAVRYLDTYRCEEGGWQITSRDMKAVHIAPWSEVEHSLTRPFNVRWPGADPLRSDCARPDR